MVVSDLEDFKNMLPNLVEFSDHYSRIIMKYDDLRKKISAKSKILNEYALKSIYFRLSIFCFYYALESNDPLLPRSLPNISFGK